MGLNVQHSDIQIRCQPIDLTHHNTFYIKYSFESGYKDACTWVRVYVVNRPVQDEHNIDGEQQSGLHTFLPLASFQLQICNFHFYRKFYQAIAVQDASSRHPVAHVQDRHSRHNVRGQHRRELGILVFILDAASQTECLGSKFHL